MTTNAQISREIKKVTGLDNIRVSSKGGCCRFYCDSTHYDWMIDIDTVYVCYLCHLSAEMWAIWFKENLDALEIDYPTKQKAA